MTLTGEFPVAAGWRSSGETFFAFDPGSGQQLPEPFFAASPADIDHACAAAAAAAAAFAATTAETRAQLLEAIADAIQDLGDELIERAHRESGLPVARLTGERGRTIGQLRLFSAELRAGGWMGIRIDPALPDRAPLPRPDLRLRMVPLGPVAVFGASNFPLAFSVAGGDTAAALAAGCPVVVKGHPAHPGTSELVARAIVAAIGASGLHPGIFSLLNGTSNALGAALVADPRIKAVGFTGSRAGGLALMKIAAQRPVPIPVYAEMSSVNPVLLFPGALASRAEALAKDFVGSMTMGSGQFCTNPGLVIALQSPDLGRFERAVAEALKPSAPQTMLTPGIHRAYEEGIARLSSHAKVETIARGAKADGANRGQAALFGIQAPDLLADESVTEEVFGASSMVVRCADSAEILRVLRGLEGQLTATLHFDEADEPQVAEVIPALEALAGRLLCNGWPTGVEVAHAMVHGGPFPATSDGRSTSVGTLAIDRFLRPVCYQNFPQSLLPATLRDGAQAGIPHRRDGAFTAG